MGEGAARIDREGTDGSPARRVAGSSRAVARQLDVDVASLREELGALVAELDRRRHELFDLKLQAKRHLCTVVLFGVAFVATTAGVVALGAWEDRRRARVLTRAAELRHAVGRVIDHPQRVGAEPPLLTRILTAAATAAMATTVKKGLASILGTVLARVSQDEGRRAGSPGPLRTR